MHSVLILSKLNLYLNLVLGSVHRKRIRIRIQLIQIHNNGHTINIELKHRIFLKDLTFPVGHYRY
jgi:hypothetical protein